MVNFDEINKTKIPDQSFVGVLQDYMESGNFGRSGVKRMSDCSLVFGGNIHPRDVPKEMCDPAFFERIHAFIPGWELPKLTDQFITPPGVGFLADWPRPYRPWRLAAASARC